MPNKIKMIDLGKLWNPSLRNEINLSIESIVSRGQFVNGPEVKEFEKSLAQFIGMEEVVGVSSGTASLECALRAFRIGVGDEVIVPANSYIASAFAVSAVGATPIFCDVDPLTWLAGWEQIEPKITDKTKAIIVVHMWGFPAPISDIEKSLYTFTHENKDLTCYKSPRKIYLIEDVAQALGAMESGRMVGSFGDASCMSFYPIKNLGCWGDGGAVAFPYGSNDDVDYVRSFINQGQTLQNVHTYRGQNYRLDTIQAAILNVGLRNLEQWNAVRFNTSIIYNFYIEIANGKEDVLRIPKPYNRSYKYEDGSYPIFHQYPIWVRDRSAFLEAAKENNIEVGIHYPTPIHASEYYIDKNDSVLPVVEDLANHIVSIPIHPELTSDEISQIVGLFIDFVRKTAIL